MILLMHFVDSETAHIGKLCSCNHLTLNDDNSKVSFATRREFRFSDPPLLRQVREMKLLGFMFITYSV